MEDVKRNGVEVFNVKIFDSKGIQKVLNKAFHNRDLGFEDKMGALNDVLSYPGLWDEGNILKFIDVFYGIAKRYNYNNENIFTMQLVWKRFEELRAEQLMEKITLSTESEVKDILKSQGRFRGGRANGLGGVGAYSVGK